MSKCLQKFNPRAVPAEGCNGDACAACADPCEVEITAAAHTGKPVMLDPLAFGHCGHAPQCVNDGAMDDRDPLGCCRCGDRKREQAEEAAQRLAGSAHTSECEQQQRDGRAENRRALMLGFEASPVICTCSVDGRGLYARGAAS